MSSDLHQWGNCRMHLPAAAPQLPAPSWSGVTSPERQLSPTGRQKQTGRWSYFSQNPRFFFELSYVSENTFTFTATGNFPPAVRDWPAAAGLLLAARGRRIQNAAGYGIVLRPDVDLPLTNQRASPYNGRTLAALISQACCGCRRWHPVTMMMMIIKGIKMEEDFLPLEVVRFDVGLPV